MACCSTDPEPESELVFGFWLLGCKVGIFGFGFLAQQPQKYSVCVFGFWFLVFDFGERQHPK